MTRRSSLSDNSALRLADASRDHRYSSLQLVCCTKFSTQLIDLQILCAMRTMHAKHAKKKSYVYTIYYMQPLYNFF